MKVKLTITLLCFFIIFAFMGCNNSTVSKSGKLKIALIFPSGKDDLAWSQSMYDALLDIQKEMGEANLEISVTEKIVNPVDAGTAIRDYANRGYNIIIAHGSQYQNPVMEVSSEFPNISFAYGTAFKTAPNVFSYDPQTQEGGYLFGILSAKITKSKVIGVVGPINGGDAIKYNSGFKDGALSVNPSIKVLESYTGSFGDTVKAKEMAAAHIDTGADILTGTAQQAVGAIQSVSEHGGVYWFSNDMNQISLSPDHIIAAQTYNWKSMVTYIIESYKKGKFGGEKLDLNYLNGGLEIVFNPKLENLITPEIKKLFDESMEKIKKGEIKIELKKN